MIASRFPRTCWRASCSGTRRARLQELPEHIRVKAEAVSTLSPNELPLKRAKEVWAGSFERDYLTQLLKRHNGNISQAAKAACVDRKTVHRLMKKYGIKPS